MNRNTIIGLVLIFAIFIGWSYWMQPTEEELEQQRQEQLAQERERRIFDSIQEVNRAEQQAIKNQLEEQAAAEPIASDTSVEYHELSKQYGGFGLSGEGTEEFITVESDLMKLSFSNKGGKIHSVELKDYKTYDSVPLILFNADSARFGFSFYS